MVERGGRGGLKFFCVYIYINTNTQHKKSKFIWSLEDQTPVLSILPTVHDCSTTLCKLILNKDLF